MPTNKCYVLECDSSRNTTKHAFPKIDDDFQLWVERTCNPILKNMSKGDVLKKCAICRKHFDESCLSPGTKRLNYRSLPTLHLPISSLHLKSHNRPATDKTQNLSTSTTSSGDRTTILKLVSATVTNKTQNFSIPITSYDQAPIFKFGLTTVKAEPGNASISTISNDNTSSSLDTSPNNTHIPLSQQPKYDGILNRVSVRRSQLTPTSMKLYDEIKKLKRQKQRLKIKSLNYKKKFKNAKKNYGLEILAQRVNSVTYKFIQSQLRNQQKTPRGQRFTDDDKILANSIYKQSPAAYQYLSTIFALPSKKTIKRLLGSDPVNTEINNTSIIEH
ncbi:Zinc finger, C2CH-type [Cinara cedri]|uniref:Zinc finger, C2CH-type n=1 Tax=Cinara cedri TaxID=506608 RepID=A0A5E4MUM2_9HEMI|nr:Zinc finger, C2CH-type [Cinara cedri]